MERQTERRDVREEHRQQCRLKLAVLTEQRDDLVVEINQLFEAVMTKQQQLKVYRQFKMYNDPKYRIPRPE